MPAFFFLVIRKIMLKNPYISDFKQALRKKDNLMIKNVKCIFSVLLTAAILLASITGCDSKEDKTNSTASKTVSNTTFSTVDPLNGEGKNGQIKLKVWAPDAAVSLCIKQCKKFSEDMKSYGDIKISVVPQGEANSATMALTEIGRAHV